MSRARPDTAVTPPPPLNPHFEHMLPEMIEDLSQVIIAIKGQLDTANIRTGQFLDHMQFEIDKIKLSLDRLQWEPKVDQDEASRLQMRLSKLLEIQQGIDGKDVMASLTFIESLRDRMAEDLLPA